MKLGYLLIAISFAANANCRVAGNDIVCDNSNTTINTYWMINRPVIQPIPAYVINQPVQQSGLVGIPPEEDFLLINQLDITNLRQNSEIRYGNR